ncbi:VOC family protein [Thalassomonas haliotis]|uniref:VOC family protein n=1 Tax=Thalassomonas haliotis TaxID=485448 RepID=A0ABY7VJR4_9GAMM|nr:VOC family protein [Thalassomonas haliotis]WDE13740.1 VOC family protein [Thalassomonas haliotis]
MKKQQAGELAWIDLTVGNAVEVKDFYQQVIGWQAEAVDMGEYNDYSMNHVQTNEPVTGICHARGVNANLPASWLPYFLVADIEQAAKQVVAQGGELLTEIKSMGGEDRYVVIKDPAGAACALYYKKIV